MRLFNKCPGLMFSPRRRCATTRRWGASESLAALVAATAYLVSGCAALPPGSERDPRDHAERFNRAMYKFNSSLDHAVLRPIARGYVKVTSPSVRTGVSNFFSNLGYTKTIGNDLFQGHVRDLGSDSARFIVNTTVGIGGVFDPASRFGLEKHDRDFGQTLGKWGVPAGSFLMLPLLGPSDVRDGIGLLPDRFMSLEAQITGPAGDGLMVGDKIDGRQRILPYDDVLASLNDPYAMVRGIWLQRRENKVHEDASASVATATPESE